MSRVLFYIERDLHLPFLLPVLKELEKYPDIEVGLSAAPFIAPGLQRPGQGLTEEKLQNLKEQAPVFEHPRQFAPHITVVADACQKLLPEYIGPTVNISHGLICKGTFYTPLPRSCRENLASTLCVPGPWHKKRLNRQVDIPVKVTGFIKTDQLLSPDTCDRKTFNFQKNLPLDACNILYAPTYTPDLSSLPWLLPYLEDLTDLDANLLIKLHNMTPPLWVDACQELARKNPRVSLLADSSYAAMMQHADLMLSDVSSIFVEFMLMDKPVVLFRHPHIKNFARFDPLDIEYQVSEAVEEVKNPSKLKDKIDKELEHPEKRSLLRTKYRQGLDYKRDGKSHKRVAQYVLETLERVSRPGQKTKKDFLILIDGFGAEQRAIKDSIQEIHKAGFEQNMQVCCWAEHKADNTSLNITNMDMQGICSAIEQSRADYSILLKPGYHLPYNWAKHLALHLYWLKQQGIIRALFQREIANMTLKHFDYSQAEQMSDLTAAHYLRTAAIESRATGISGPTPCVLAPLDMSREIVQQCCPVSVADLSNKLHQKAAKENKPILTALDIFICPFASTNDIAALF